jgi:hypothetical protein
MYVIQRDVLSYTSDQVSPWRVSDLLAVLESMVALRGEGLDDFLDGVVDLGDPNAYRLIDEGRARQKKRGKEWVRLRTRRERRRRGDSRSRRGMEE